MVYGRKQPSLHMHMHNPVTLVWGSLRLAPIILAFSALDNFFHLRTIGT